MGGAKLEAEKVRGKATLETLHGRLCKCSGSQSRGGWVGGAAVGILF